MGQNRAWLARHNPSQAKAHARGNNRRASNPRQRQETRDAQFGPLYIIAKEAIEILGGKGQHSVRKEANMKVSITIEAQGITDTIVVLWKSNQFEMNSSSTHKFIESTQKTLNNIFNSRENGNDATQREGQQNL